MHRYFIVKMIVLNESNGKPYHRLHNLIDFLQVVWDFKIRDGVYNILSHLATWVWSYPGFFSDTVVLLALHSFVNVTSAEHRVLCGNGNGYGNCCLSLAGIADDAQLYVDYLFWLCLSVCLSSWHTAKSRDKTININQMTGRRRRKQRRRRRRAWNMIEVEMKDPEPGHLRGGSCGEKQSGATLGTRVEKVQLLTKKDIITFAGKGQIKSSEYAKTHSALALSRWLGLESPKNILIAIKSNINWAPQRVTHSETVSFFVIIIE